MTMPTSMPAALPEPGYPMLTRMISGPPFPEPSRGAPPGGGEEKQFTWIVGQPHPLVQHIKVVRMSLDRGGVEVYSVWADGKAGMRNLVPLTWVRLVEEVMPLDVFVEDLAVATGDGGGEPELEPSKAPDAQPAAVGPRSRASKRRTDARRPR